MFIDTKPNCTPLSCSFCRNKKGDFKVSGRWDLTPDRLEKVILQDSNREAEEQHVTHQQTAEGWTVDKYNVTHEHSS